ncbi:hypothetical protein DS259_01840 [Salmonella enterica subsp. indica]|nr:hypothetical protein [Salmonella enterica subsp. indica]
MLLNPDNDHTKIHTFVMSFTFLSCMTSYLSAVAIHKPTQCNVIDGITIALTGMETELTQRLDGRVGAYRIFSDSPSLMNILRREQEDGRVPCGNNKTMRF